MITSVSEKMTQTRSYLSYKIYVSAKKYIKRYEGFNYNFQKNGEESFLNKLKGQNISTVFDVGANVGDWCEIALSKFTDAKVYSFELSEATYKTLSDKHANNDRVVLNNYGLSDNIGEIKYKDYGVNSGVNTILNNADFHDKNNTPHLIKAKLSTGSEYCQSVGISHIDLLKIDVEGAEHLVLKGFSDLLEKGNIKVIQFEYGYTNADAKFLVKDFYNMLEGYGYILGPLKPSGVLFMDFDYALNDFNSGPNFVAVHKSCDAIIKAVQGKAIKGFPRK